MKKYNNYKDSGIEWIGDIPSNWSSTKLKFHTKKIIDGAHFTPTYIEKSNDSIPFLRVTDLHSKEILLDEVKYIPTSEHQELIKRCNPEVGDLLLSKNGTIGLMKIIDWDWEFSIFVSLCLLKFEKTLLNKFFFYFFESNIVDRQLFESSQKTSVSNLHLEKIKELRLTLPPIEEQTAIANYLDHKTTQIDTLIAKKEQFISLLQEERTAIINQAVTKGLDPTVKMKDSGIEWLGEIPEHWEVAKFNLYVSIRHGHQFMNHDFTDDGVKVVKITQLHKDGYLDLSKCSYVSSEQLENYQSILIKEKDILMCLTGGTIGKIIRVGEVNEPLLQNYRVGHFSSGKASKISDDFIFWLMSSESIVSQIFFQMRETGQPNIGMDDFGRMRITIPPLMEQEKIVKHIVNKTVEISEILIKSKQEIELLKEYKTALISEVVTGKVDVRDVILN